jgi:hypothetical protein
VVIAIPIGMGAFPVAELGVVVLITIVGARPTVVQEVVGVIGGNTRSSLGEMATVGMGRRRSAAVIMLHDLASSERGSAGFGYLFDCE